MSNNPPYKLRCSLPGHSKDVRCLVVGDLGEECIVSGSRDKTAKLWMPEGLGYICSQTYTGSEGYVSAVTLGLCSDNFPTNFVIAGCQDGKIRVYVPGTTTPTIIFTGHTDTVCSLVTQNGFLLSGSWDRTARLWRSDGSPVMTLSGHAAAVWAVEFLQCSDSASEIITLTASADKTIKMWKGDLPFQTFKGHTDCVRALAVCDSSRFLSAANDASIRLWVISGECIATFYGHTNYIYGLCMMPNKTDFVSCGEDRSVRLWKLDNTEECQQTVFLPAQSIWSVKAMQNGDIVTGSSDGLVRVFTNAPERVATTDVLKAYEAELAATSLSAQLELGGIKASDLPGPESLFEPGTREGQTKMVRNGETVSCYSWSASDNQWTKVGDVVGAAGQSDSSKTLYDGKEYDYVFSVDIDEGKPPLKLPYNTSEDPWLAAQKFIHKNDLSQYHLDTIANFIITNSKNESSNGSKTNANETFTDPFTGGSRYVPSSGTGVTGSATSTGDPFTGSGRYVPSGQAERPKPQSSFFPVKDFLRFEQANLEAITGKLKEFNGKVDVNLQLTEAQLLSFVHIADPNSTNTEIPHLETLLRWPYDNIFPALDVLRLATRNARIANLLVEKDGILEVLVAIARSSVANCMLVYRTIAHLIMHNLSQKIVMDNREVILTSILSLIADTDPSFSKHSQWKNVEISVSTVILNLAVLFHTKPSFATIEDKSHLLSVLGEIVLKLHEEEALFRILAATGTLLTDTESVAAANSLEFNSKIELLQSIIGKVGECAKQVLIVFK